MLFWLIIIESVSPAKSEEFMEVQVNATLIFKDKVPEHDPRMMYISSASRQHSTIERNDLFLSYIWSCVCLKLSSLLWTKVSQGVYV